MKRNLTTNEIQTLQHRHRREKNGKSRDRIKAVLLYDKGYSYVEIAEILLLDDETIRRHIHDYFSKNKLKGESGGSQSHLDSGQSEKLIAHLEDKTYLYVKDICAYVKQHFNVSYSLSGMTKWLNQNGFRYKKPQPVPGKVNKALQQEFITYYEELKLKKGEKEPIYFVDSVHPQHQTHITHGWISKGIRKNIATTGKQKRLNFMGAICLDGHKIVMQQSDKVDAESIKKFLKSLRQKNPGERAVHVIWDNAGYHRSKDVQRFAKGLNVDLHYLPPYSPNLNPIERLWKLMHEQVSYNKYYEKFAVFRDATLLFFKNIVRKKKLLRARITDNFQIVEEPNFAF